MADMSRAASFQSSDVGAYLGPGAKVNGKLLFEGNTTIEGDIDGEIMVRGDLTIGERATIKGKVAATSILIRGKVTASVHAEKRLEIQPPGVVVGDMITPSLVVVDGALIEGHCSMKKEKDGKVLPLLRQDAGASSQGSSPD